MKKDLHNDIDHLFKSAIDEHGEEVPEGIWEKIDSQLDKKQVISFQKKYYRIRRLAIALLLLGIIGSVYALFVYIGQKQKDPDRAAVQTGTKPASINKAVPTGTKGKNEESPGQNLQRPADQAVAEQKEQEDRITGLTPGSGQPNDNSTKADKERVTTGALSPNTRKGAEKRGKTLPGSTAGTAASFQKTIEKLSSSKKGRKDIAAASRQTPVPQDLVKPGQPKDTAEGKAAAMKPAAPVSSLPTTLFLARPQLFRPLSSTPERTDIASTGTAAAAGKGKKLRKAFLSLTLFASPDFTINRLENNERLAGPGRNREEVKKNEHPSSSFSSGLLVTYEATPRWSIGSGLILSASTSDIAGKTIYAKPDSRGNIRYELNSAAGMSYLMLKSMSGGTAGPHPDSVVAAGTKSSVKYLEIPLSVQYRIGKGKFTVSPGVGLSANFLTAGKVQTTVSNPAFAIREESRSTITGLKSSFSGLTGINAAYRINSRISLNFMPGTRFGLSAINKDTPVKSYQNRVSLAAGLSLHL